MATLFLLLGMVKWVLPPISKCNKFFYVPSLSTNLLSVYKLTQDLNCRVIFSPHRCVFQDLTTRRTIGVARAHKGLYFLQQQQQPYDFSVGEQSILSHVSQFNSNKEDVWLHHLQLGHPPFPLLKSMFPKLFHDLNASDFHCDICEISKHHRVPYAISHKLSLFPFSSVHFDVWGPSKTLNCSGLDDLCLSSMIALAWLGSTY